MIMIALVSIQVLSQLKDATTLRKHSIQVILGAQSFENTLLDMQRGLRSYVTTGDTNAQASFEASVKLEPPQFAQLLELTRDNPIQQQRLKALSAAMQIVRSYDRRMIDIYKRLGIDAAVKADIAGVENRAVFGDARDTLKAFSDEEEALLTKRDSAEESQYRDAERLLVIGSVLAVILLLLADLVASRELTVRRRAEVKLNCTLMLQNAIFNSANYAIVTTDPNGIVQTFNPAAEQLLGYSAKEVIGSATPMLWRDPQEIAERAASLSKRLGRPIRPTFEAVSAKVQFEDIDEGEWTFIHKSGRRFTSSLVVTALTDHTGNFTGYLGIFRDISVRKSLEADREKLIVELKDALAQVKTLSGLIPICGWCKSVRNDTGYWQTVEQYVRSRSDVTFTHGICPACQEKFKADIINANAGKSDAV